MSFELLLFVHDSPVENNLNLIISRRMIHGLHDFLSLSTELLHMYEAGRVFLVLLFKQKSSPDRVLNHIQKFFFHMEAVGSRRVLLKKSLP